MVKALKSTLHCFFREILFYEQISRRTSLLNESYLTTVLSLYIHIKLKNICGTVVFLTLRRWYGWLAGCLGFYGISTFVGYLMLNPFLYKQSVLFQAIHFSISTQFNCQKYFYFKLFSLVKQF